MLRFVRIFGLLPTAAWAQGPVLHLYTELSKATPEPDSESTSESDSESASTPHPTPQPTGEPLFNEDLVTDHKVRQTGELFRPCRCRRGRLAPCRPDKRADSREQKCGKLAAAVQLLTPTSNSPEAVATRRAITSRIGVSHSRYHSRLLYLALARSGG